MDCEANARELLEHMLLDANIEPTALPLSLLKAITNNFSDDLQIGSGGYAVVYKGLLHNGTVAVKKLSQTLDMQQDKLNQEIGCLVRVKHKNIVRFLGYCADTQGKMWNYEGKLVMADEWERLLCFEFLPKGGLDNYISDASRGLEWGARYQIITGICYGLHYLHQQNIVHLDLKPANILLDYNMVPKITDFGISRCFNEKQTQDITLNPRGTLGYMAPELYSGLITIKSDIYSLGVIIMEILTGQKGYAKIENVLESWSTRFEMPHHVKQLEQVRICAEIGLACTDFNPMNRPDTPRIIEMLGEVEGKTDPYTSSAPHASITSNSKLVDEAQLMDMSAAPSQLQRIISVSKGPGETSTEIRSLGFSESANLLDVHPLELRFPWESNKPSECAVTLTNRTDQYVGVWITRTNIYFPALWDEFRYLSLFKTLEPHSTQFISVNMKEQQQPAALDTGMFEVVMIIFGSKEEHIKKLRLFIPGKLNLDSSLLKEIEKLGGKVHRAMLTAVICDPTTSCQPATNKIIPGVSEFGDIKSIDVHPTETWILVGHYHDGNVSIWNYKTQEKVMVLQTCAEFCRGATGVKFIAREKWFIATIFGFIHVYSYTTMEKIKEFKAHFLSVYSWAVHPTDPFLLTSSFKEGCIKLWDWGQDWMCTRKFMVASIGVSDIIWNLRNSNTFTCTLAEEGEVQVWDIHSSVPITRFSGTVGAAYLETDIDCHLMVTCIPFGWGPVQGVSIRDLQKRKFVHKLIMPTTDIYNFVFDPSLQVLAMSHQGPPTILLWDARTYRIEQKVLPTEHRISGMVFTGTKDTTRLMIASQKEIEILELDLPTLKRTDGGN